MAVGIAILGAFFSGFCAILHARRLTIDTAGSSIIHGSRLRDAAELIALNVNRILSAIPLPNHRLRLRFTDGVEGEVDLSHLVGRGVFEAWSDESVFRAVSVDPLTRTVTWPGGLDLCPDVLYHQVTGKPLPGQISPASSA